MNKTVLTLALGLGFIAGVLLGHSFWQSNQEPVATGASSTGAEFSTAKIAATVFAPATGSATSTSILNTDANDRYVTNAFSYCGSVGTSFTPYTGAGLAALQFTAATSSTDSPATLSNTNLTMSVTVATSSVDSSNATSTYGTAFWQRWAAGSYMTFVSNATNTAVCTVGVGYIPS